MPRVVPSQVVLFMDGHFGEALGGLYRQVPQIREWQRALVALLDRIPNELQPTAPADFAELIAGQEVLRAGSEEQGPGRMYSRVEERALREVHRILRACPDEAPAEGTSDPAFIDDGELRADLHRDLGEVNRALQNGEWKAATVLAGSVVEALLLWALQSRKPAEVTTETATLKKPLERWDLHELIDLAHRVGLISEDARVAADQGRDFRNLIHPGRAARLAAKCNRATALIGVGAVEAVMIDLAK